MLGSALRALRTQVYCKVSDSHRVFVSHGFGVNLEHSRARSRRSTEVPVHGWFTQPR